MSHAAVLRPTSSLNLNFICVEMAQLHVSFPHWVSESKAIWQKRELEVNPARIDALTWSWKMKMKFDDHLAFVMPNCSSYPQAAYPVAVFSFSFYQQVQPMKQPNPILFMAILTVTRLIVFFLLPIVQISSFWSWAWQEILPVWSPLPDWNFAPKYLDSIVKAPFELSWPFFCQK